MSELTYTARRLALRDELVLKSIIRLLQGQTRHLWRYTDSLDADLLVLGVHENGDEAHEASTLEHRAVFHVKPDDHGHPAAPLPLRVGEVLVEFNRLGELIEAAKSSHALARHASDDESVHERIALLRWPDWSLLQQDSCYLRIATVLATRPLTQVELARKSGTDSMTCSAFIRALDLDGLLVRVAPDDIRGVPHATSATSTNAINPTKPTLWSRIRSRFGIASGANVTTN
jgi:hypothetical protein